MAEPEEVHAEGRIEDELDMDEARFKEAIGAMRRKPALRPSEAEVRAHRATHLPFRDWCEECVAGSANDWPHHRRHPELPLSIPEVAADYCFPRDHAGAEFAVILVMRDRESKMLVAHVVPHKGAEQEWVTEQCVRDLRLLGHHGDLVLKSDQEAAIKDLLTNVAALRGNKRTKVEHSPVGDSRANGLAERAVQTLEKQLRVMKLAFETRVGERLSVHHPLFAWLVEHAANVLNNYLVGSDGKCPVQRLRGRAASQFVLEFGSPCMFRVVGRVEGGDMGERWFRGHWLGKKQGTEEHLVLKSDGLVVRARAVREFEEKVGLKDLEHIKSTPHDPLGTLRRTRVPDQLQRGLEHGADDREAGARNYVPKRMQITKEMVLRYGPTKGCRKCAGVASGDGGYQYVHHSEACRTRLEEAIKDDEHFRKNLDKANNRMTERIAQDLERADQRRRERQGEPRSDHGPEGGASSRRSGTSRRAIIAKPCQQE